MIKQLLRTYFIPQKSNGFKPHILQKAAVSGMFVLIILSFTLANLNALFLVSSTWLSGEIISSVLVDLTNEEREGEVVGMLARNADLDRAATLKAEHMAERGYFAHNSPDGLTPWHWFRLVGYNYRVAGENLAVHFTDSKNVVEAWMDSPGHRGNILNGKFTEIGIGTARGSYQGAPTIFVVQMFGTKQAAAQLPPERTVTLQGTSAEGSVLSEVTEREKPLSSGSVANERDTDTLAEQPSSTYIEIATTAPATARNEEASEEGIVAALPATTDSQSNQFERLFLQPSLWLQMVYAALAAIISVALILSIVVEWRKQHPVQIVYGTGLLAALVLMFYVHTWLTGGVLII